MGCVQSTQSDPYTEVAPEVWPEKRRRLHALTRAEKYKHRRPSFYSAYARAARRYGFEAGRYAGFAKRNDVVVKVRGHRHKETHHEVPTESIQNGQFLCGAVGPCAR